MGPRGSQVASNETEQAPRLVSHDNEQVAHLAETRDVALLSHNTISH